MSLAYVILGLLQQQERTGYDLKTECFDDGIAHLWPADQAQIYRTLEKLEMQGWITCTVEIQYNRPNRKIYRITEAGQAGLIQWLQTPQPSPVLREPLLVQLYFAAQLPNEAILHLLEQERTVQQQKLAECNGIALSALSATQSTRDQDMQRLILGRVIRREQTYLAWLEETIAALRHSST